MNVRTDIRSPYHTQTVIPIEFLVIHYTACDLERALAIFENPGCRVSCHFLLAEDGELFELVPCLTTGPLRAAHAGHSTWTSEGHTWTGFNEFSVGIELVNFNGNLLEYSDQQYCSLASLINLLKNKFPPLRNPNRGLGHEHVAGWRGKADPGRCFSWSRLFNDCYPQMPPPTRHPMCPLPLQKALGKFLQIQSGDPKNFPSDPAQRTLFWRAVSATTEAAVELAHNQGSLNMTE